MFVSEQNLRPTNTFCGGGAKEITKEGVISILERGPAVTVGVGNPKVLPSQEV